MFTGPDELCRRRDRRHLGGSGYTCSRASSTDNANDEDEDEDDANEDSHAAPATDRAKSILRGSMFQRVENT